MASSGRAAAELFELYIELVSLSWTTISLKKNEGTLDKRVLQTLQTVLTKYKVSLLLEGKLLAIFVANDKILFNQNSQFGEVVSITMAVTVSW